MEKAFVALCNDHHDFRYLESDINTINTLLVTCEKCGLTKLTETCYFGTCQ